MNTKIALSLLALAFVSACAMTPSGETAFSGFAAETTVAASPFNSAESPGE